MISYKKIDYIFCTREDTQRQRDDVKMMIKAGFLFYS